MSGVFCNLFPPCILRQCLLLKWELRLTGRWTRRSSCLHLPSTVRRGTCASAWFFYMGPGGPASGINSTSTLQTEPSLNLKAYVGNGWYAMKETKKIKHRKLSKLFFQYVTHTCKFHSFNTLMPGPCSGETLSTDQWAKQIGHCLHATSSMVRPDRRACTPHRKRQLFVEYYRDLEKLCIKTVS